MQRASNAAIARLATHSAGGLNMQVFTWTLKLCLDVCDVVVVQLHLH